MSAHEQEGAGLELPVCGEDEELRCRNVGSGGGPFVSEAVHVRLHVRPGFEHGEHLQRYLLPPG